jgi:hypothetical protein
VWIPGHRKYDRRVRFGLDSIRRGRKSRIGVRGRKRRVIDALRFPAKWYNSGEIKVLTGNNLPVRQENIEVHVDLLGVT